MQFVSVFVAYYLLLITLNVDPHQVRFTATTKQPNLFQAIYLLLYTKADVSLSFWLPNIFICLSMLCHSSYLHQTNIPSCTHYHFSSLPPDVLHVKYSCHIYKYLLMRVKSILLFPIWYQIETEVKWAGCYCVCLAR